MSNIRVKRLHHVSLLCADLQRALRFYREILDLEVDDARPDLGYDGAWLNLQGSQIHLLCLENPDPVTARPEHGGRDRHVALGVTGLQAIKFRLRSLGIPYTESRSGRPALFVRDPDGNALELIEE